MVYLLVHLNLFLHLKQEYGFNGRFKNAELFEQKHNLENKRYTLANNITEMKNFHIRLQKSRKLVYSNESNMKIKTIQSNPFICLKFIRISKVLN